MARVEIPFGVDKVVSGNLQPASGASVQINIRGGGPATIYAADTGPGTNPNPLTTDATGRVIGWVDENVYNLIISGAGFATYTQPWDATSAASALALDGARIVVGSMDGAALVANTVAGSKLTDGTVTSTKLDPTVLPVGTVIDWWRPNNSTPVPSNWKVADGTTVTSANHSFVGGGTIVLPDLRNTFILGANTANADGTAPVASSDVAASAPGIGGVGGSHFRNLQHAHTNNDHSHGGLTDTQGHHDHGINLTTSTESFDGTTGGGYNVIFSTAFAHTHSVKGRTDAGGDHWHGIATSGSNNLGMNNQLSATQDIKPKLVGLLKIIKVKN